MEQHKILVDVKKCIGCGICEQDCPQRNIRVIEKQAVIKAQDCMKCGHCVAICPKAAVTMTGFSDAPMEFAERTVLDAAQLLLAIKTRRSIRSFQQKEIPAAVIRQILEAGRYTPCAVNAQDVSYIVLGDGKAAAEEAAVALFRKLLPCAAPFVKKARGMEIDDHFFFKQAPAAIAVLSKTPINGALAASNMALMAEACGLGVLYSGLFTIAANHSGKIRRLIGMKRGEKVITTLVLGYPDVVYRRTVYREPAAVRYVLQKGVGE